MVTSERPQDGKHFELDVAADPQNPKNVIATGILTRALHPEGGKESRVYTSKDGGYSWITSAPRESVNGNTGDPQVIFSRFGTALFIAGGDPGGGAKTFIFRSEDGGVRWAKPVYAPWIDYLKFASDYTSGKFAGHIYAAGLYNPHAGIKFGDALDEHIGVLVSADDGRSWKLVDVADNHDLPGRGIVANLSPIVFTDGELLVPFRSFPYTREDRKARSNIDLFFATSSNGGKSFTKPSTVVIPGPDGKPVNVIEPLYAVDDSRGAFQNRLYLLWADHDYQVGAEKPTGKSRIWLSYSIDRGKTWSSAKMVSEGILGIGDQFMPTIAVNNSGVVGIGWYDTRDSVPGQDEMVNQYFAASVDGGESVSPARRVSSEPTDPVAQQKNVLGIEPTGPNGIWFVSGPGGYGDYMEIAAGADGAFHPVWIDGRTGSGQIWTASIRVDKVPPKSEQALQLVDADVTPYLHVWVDPIRNFSASGTIEVPIRLKNTSSRTIYGPLQVEVTLIRGPYDYAAKKYTEVDAILNSANGLQGKGAIFDYSRSLGDTNSLAPQAISEGVVWRLRAPGTESVHPQITFKIKGRIESSTQTNPANDGMK